MDVIFVWFWCNQRNSLFEGLCHAFLNSSIAIPNQTRTKNENPKRIYIRNAEIILFCTRTLVTNSNTIGMPIAHKWFIKSKSFDNKKHFRIIRNCICLYLNKFRVRHLMQIYRRKEPNPFPILRKKNGSYEWCRRKGGGSDKIH